MGEGCACICGRIHFKSWQLRHQGGCFLADTGVLTPSRALTSIDRLCLGDDVMAFDADGALHRATVRGRMSFLSEKHYEISLSNGSMVRVIASHPVAVAPGIFSRADTLAEGHSVMIHSCDDDDVMLGSATVEHVKCVADNAGCVQFVDGTSSHFLCGWPHGIQQRRWLWCRRLLCRRRCGHHHQEQQPRVCGPEARTNAAALRRVTRSKVRL